jgi:hypothetical protein
MKQTWETAEASIMIFKQELEELHELLPKSVKIHQKVASLNKAWKKVQTSLNEMDKFITPVKSVEVKSNLLNDPTFRDSWILWKEYLNEQHGIFMRSRAELVGLKRMMDISGDDPKTAISFLEYSMSRLEKAFYKVVEKEDKKPKTKASGAPTIIKLGAKYKNPHADPLEGLAN